MAIVEITVIHQLTGDEKQIELSIPDDVVSSNLSILPDLIKSEVEKTDPCFMVSHFSLKADKGIKWQ